MLRLQYMNVNFILSFQDGKDYLSSQDSVIMTTKDNEKYKCLMPPEFKTEEVK